MKHILEKVISEIVTEMGASDVTVKVDHPGDLTRGDYTTNVAMMLAKHLKRSPLEIAKEIVKELEIQKGNLESKGVDHSTDRSDQMTSFTGSKNNELQDIEKIEAVPPGFINFHLSASALSNLVPQVIEAMEAFGTVKSETGKRIVVEFTDPNPFKELHIGHLYSNAVGESLCRLWESSGNKVRRVNYQGDVGMHVAKSIWGMQQKLKSDNLKVSDLEKRPLSERVKFLGQSYSLGSTAYEEKETAKEEIKDINYLVFIAAQEHLQETQNWQPQVDYKQYVKVDADKYQDVKELYAKGRTWSLDYFESIYKRLGTKFDGYYFESIVGEYGVKIVKEHLGNVFKESDGAVIYEGEKHGLHTRVFINKLGLPTYEAKELGLAPTKYGEWKYDASYIVTGKEINEYFKVLLAALKDVSPELGSKTNHIGHGMVRLPTGKMSSRTGKVLTGEWLVDEVKKAVYSLIDKNKSNYAKEQQELIAEKASIAAIKYSLLKVSLPADITFDIEKSVSFEGDSGPYLQYTYARAKSVLRKVGEEVIAQKATSNEFNTEERTVLMLIHQYPEVVESAAKNLSPSTLATHLYKLASAFNTFYNSHSILGNDKEGIKEDQKSFRLALTAATAQVLKNGLYLLGIETLEQM